MRGAKFTPVKSNKTMFKCEHMTAETVLMRCLLKCVAAPTARDCSKHQPTLTVTHQCYPMTLAAVTQHQAGGKQAHRATHWPRVCGPTESAGVGLKNQSSSSPCWSCV